MLDVQSALHAHADDLELYARGRLEPGHTSNIEAHLLECQTCQGRFFECLGLQLRLHAIGMTGSQEKYERSEPRFCAGDHATLQELSPLSLERLTVEIVDVSKHGLGILMPRPVLPGTIVQVRIKTTVEVGETRHCSALGDGQYRIGVRLHT